jgi:hypothetical protein
MRCACHLVEHILLTRSDVLGRVPAMVPPVRSEVLPVTPVPLSILHNRAHLDRCADERTASHKSMEKERRRKDGKMARYLYPRKACDGD